MQQHDQSPRSVDPQRNVNRLLIDAVVDGDYAECSELIKSKADVNYIANPDFKTTPLQSAAYEGHIHVCRLLLNAKANINDCDNFLGTALYYAATRG